MLRALISFCIKRRLPVLVATLGIGLYGLTALFDTPIEAYPDVTNYQINVIAQLPGLAAEEIERQVTIPLERALNGTPGVLIMRTESSFGLSLAFLTFDDDVDAFKARTLVSQRIATAELPQGVEPVVAPDITPLGEVFQFRVASDRHTPAELRSELDWTITKHLLQVPGVGDVVNFGGFIKEVHVRVDPSRLRAHDLSLGDVTQALEKSNRNVGGGFLTRGDQEVTVRGIGHVISAQDIQETVLHSERGTPVTIGDVATVVLSHTPRRGSVGFDKDLEAVFGLARMRRGENPSLVLAGIHAKVKELNERILPRGMRIEPFIDRSTLVGQTLSTVRHNLLFGALLVVGVVWMFLRSLRCSLVVAAVIPLALLTAFIGLNLVHLPANLISMGAIDFGILVDGAVVLAEGVLNEVASQRPGQRRQVLKLVVRSALSVSRPTFFAMAIIIAALIPVFSLQRVEGRIFRPLALTYSFALAGALVFALTLVPALCALVLHPRSSEISEPKLLSALRGVYKRALGVLLQRRVLVLGGASVLALATASAGWRVGTEFLPELDEGDLHVYVEMPASVSLERGASLLREVRKRLLRFPEVARVMSEQGRPEDATDNEMVNQSETFVHLWPREQWRRGWTKERLIDVMRTALEDIPGVRFNFTQPIQDNVEEAVSGVRGKVVLKVFGTDLQSMRDTLQRSLAALKKVKGIVDLSLYRDMTVPQLQLVLNRPALARAGASVGAATDVIETALGGKVATTFWERERPVPVRVLLPPGERDDESGIGDLPVPGAGNSQVPLREVARIDRALGRANIVREANSRVAALKFNVEGRDMGSVVRDAVETVKREVRVDEGNYLVWSGEFENQQRAMARLSMVIPLSFLVVFALLYLALGSVRSALAILLTAPFAMSGGVFALAATGIALSVSAAVGFITLLGQVTLASLLIVSAVDERRRAGGPLGEALVAGATQRFRAVLMTALLAILGLMPAALSTSVGSETQRPFAIVIIGGLFTTVLVTLFVLPAIYSLVAARAPRPVAEEAPELEPSSP